MLSTYSVDEAAGDNPHLRGLLQDMMDSIQSTTDQIGAATATLSTVPDPAQMAISGADGYFTVRLTNPQDVQPTTIDQLTQQAVNNPNPLGSTILHQLQSSTESTFNTPSLIKEYPLSADTNFTFQDVNVTKFWRLRSKFENGPFNDWQTYTSVTSCGIISVYSGLLRESSLDYLSTAATTSNGLSPLSQDGVTSNILVAASIWNEGDKQIPYTPGHNDPGVFGTFHIYALDPFKAGGTVNFLATTNVADLTAQSGIIYFGHITTAGGGGGVGAGGGGGGGDPGGGAGCSIGAAMATMFDGLEKPHRLLRKGDAILGTNGQREVLQRDPDLRVAPCFMVEMSNGLIHPGCSSTHQFMYDGGGFDQIFNQKVGDRLHTKLGAATITKITFIGMHVVYLLTLDGSRTYYAAGIGSHNYNKL